MIIRVLGDGQYDLAGGTSPAFDALDQALVDHVNAGDEQAYQRDLAALIELVRSEGVELPEGDLSPSDLVLPDPAASIEEVQALLAEEGQHSV